MLAPMGTPQVFAAEVAIGGQKVEIHYASFAYPTDLAAAKAWERASRKSKVGQGVSVYRLPNGGVPLVVALSEEEDDVLPMARAIAPTGVFRELDQATLLNLVMRRGRVAATNDTPGDSKQQMRYGSAGALFDQLGQARPAKRPQG